MINEDRLKMLNRRANIGVAVFVGMLIGTLCTIGQPWYICLPALILMFIAAGYYVYWSNLAWEEIEKDLKILGRR